MLPMTCRIFSLVLITACALAQTAAGPMTALNFVPSGDLPGFTIAKTVNEVNLIFTVTDTKNRLSPALGASDFRLLDNHHAPAALRYFQHQSELPLRVGLLIDNSSSITERFKYEKKAAGEFLKRMLRPGIDQAFVVAFDDDVHLMHDFSSDVPALQTSISRMRPGGNTSLYDALIYAAKKLHKSDESTVTRRVIILISDGVDTKSKAIMHDVQEAAVRADAVVFCLSTNDLHVEYPRGEAVLELVSGPTGGYILPAREEAHLKKAFTQLEKILRNQYALGYTPSDFTADGTFHSVDIIPVKSGLRVRCRKGYFAEKK
ncbi:MAG TPA: VWA domain-containing protein [Terriglobales bacterium]|nr:VWA domain-containing protein [Terriglobales bacterium]